MKIANKISLSFLITAITLTVITAFFVYITEKDNLQQQIFAHLRSIATSRKNHIERMLKEDKVRIELMASTYGVVALLEQIIDDAPNSAGFAEDLSLRLKEFSKIDKETYEIFILNLEGKIVASSDKTKIGLDRASDPYFLEGKKRTYIKNAYYSEVTKKNSLDISAPILSKAQGETIGVLVARFELIELNKMAGDRNGLGKTGEIYLVNKDGYMITDSRFMKDTFLKLKVDTENAKNCLLHHPPIISIAPDYRGVRVVGAHDYIEEMGWAVLAEIDEKEALRPLVKLKYVLFTVLVSMPIIAWLIGFFISKLLTKSIDRLQKGAEIVGEGDLDYKVEIEAKDEIGQLSRVFDRMTENLKKTTTSMDNLKKEIAERKKIEKELLDSEEFSESIIKSSYDCIMVLDLDGRLRYMSEGGQKLMQIKDIKEYLGRSWTDFWEGLDKEACLEAISKAKEGKVGTFHGYCPTAEVIPKWWSTIITPILDAAGKVQALLGVSRDITESKKAELDLEKAYEKLKTTQMQLIQSEKLASIGRIAAGVAHEINNPLSAISGEAEISLKDKKIDKETKDALKVIVEQAQRIKTISEELLEFSRARKLDLKPLDINRPLEKSISLLGYQVKREDIQIVKGLDSQLPKILGDENQIQEVFLNIMLNAVQAMENGGKLTIKTYADKIKKYGRRETDILKFDQDIVVAEFSDTGKGMDEKIIKRLFEPFFTTKEKSTGLGLAICYGIIEKHGGIIEVKSQLGKGSTFFVKLPIAIPSQKWRQNE